MKKFGSRTTKIMTANEKRSFVLKNLTSNRIRASSIATHEKSAKYCKISFIYGVFKVYITRNFLSPSWKDLLKQYNNFFCSFSFSFF